MAEPVEIKVTLEGDVDDALSRLGLDNADSTRKIYFAEDTTPGLNPPLPLLSAGIVIRLRYQDNSKGDSTIKLRPCRRSQLGKGWTTAFEKATIDFRLEQDWSGDRHVLAASCVARVPETRLRSVLKPVADITGAFNETQFAFLADCANLKVAFSGLTLLGPITAYRWDAVAIKPEDVVAERWVVGDLDFLELSIRANDVSSAIRAQASFHKAVQRCGLTLNQNQETKTRQVLTYLAGQ